MDVQTDDADTELSTQMASVAPGEQADVIVQAIGEAVAESRMRSALGQVESGIHSALDQQESGIRSTPLLGGALVVLGTSVEVQAQPEVEVVRVFVLTALRSSSLKSS